MVEYINPLFYFYTEHELQITQLQVCTLYLHVYMIQNAYIIVKTCTYMSEQCTYMFIPWNVHTMYIPCTYVYIQPVPEPR